MEKKTKNNRLSPQASRRLLGGGLLEKGYGIDEVMDITGASLSAVKRWKRVMKAEGFSGLQPKENGGRPTRLTDEQRDQLCEIITAGAVSSGFENECWTGRRIAKIILEKFGVAYHFRSVGRIPRAMGLSYQTPDTQAKNRSPEAIAHWKKHVWPRLKKSPKVKEYPLF